MLSFASSFGSDSEAFAIFVNEKFHFEDRKNVLSKESSKKINSYLSTLKDKKSEEEINSLDISGKQKCFIIKVKKKYETYYPEEKGGIFYSQESLEKVRIAVNCGYVLKMGPLAYYDKEKFPTGPWCKTGQWVVFARYAGSRLPIEGGEVRILNDDEVLGTIKDPESILHYI